ncbi:Uncharacterized protein dnm_024970 [Desulfonema magnum]|uniref:Uncharacterized protein n=1 Tax=Desulfonema magnum TaxID=45655 RepID=A0A975GMA4_9BACT|nr:Uncharacterized protein dnm_024970 [Desulfonema magnum]
MHQIETFFRTSKLFSGVQKTASLYFCTPFVPKIFRSAEFGNISDVRKSVYLAKLKVWHSE